MLNPATNPPEDGFNEYTTLLKQQLLAGKEVLVELRNGRVIELEWFVGTGYDDGIEHFCYRKNGCYLVWNHDGTSITSDRFDIMGDVEE